MNHQEIAKKTSSLFQEFGVNRAALFGSTARGEQGPESDVDVLIELSEPLGLFKFAKLNYLLEDALNKKVDLVKRSALKPGFEKTILRDLVYIYG